MKSLKLSGIALLAALTLGTYVPQAEAQNCSLNACTVNCAGGCGVSFPIQHAGVGYGPAYGAFALQGTEFENTCGGLGACTAMVPALRFWAYNSFGSANSGCVDQLGAQWMINPALDFGLGTAVGDWALYQANWAAATAPSMTTVDGCITAVTPFPQTVAELSFTGASAGEGTSMHDSWYLVASVAGGPFDYDVITGGNTSTPPGSGPANVKVQRVPNVTGAMGATIAATCPQHASQVPGTPNTDANYFNVSVTGLSNTSPDYFTAMGRNAGNQLIAGMQVVYASGAAPPTTSVTGWLPARDVAAPSTNVAGIWPHGAAGPVMVALPVAGAPHWLAVRLVYTDASRNAQVGPGPEAMAPQVVSLVGQHCGPFVGDMVIAVEFDSVTAERTGEGVEVRWTTSFQDDVLGFKVWRFDNQELESGVDAVGWVDAVPTSTGASYSATDFAVAGDTVTTYYYQVQEITSNGFGMKSPVVRVEGAVFQENGPAGGRSRTGSRR